MIRWLRYRLARLWYWRHRVVTLEHNVFSGRAVFWCGRCGATVHAQRLPIGHDTYSLVTRPSWYPVARAVFRYQAPLHKRVDLPRATVRP